MSKEITRAVLLSKVIVAFMAVFIVLAAAILFLVLSPGRLLMGFSAEVSVPKVQIGEPVSFELCRSGPAIPRKVEAVRTTDRDGSSEGIEYTFSPTIESEGCEPFVLVPKRIPQVPGTYVTTTNVFFDFLGVPKDTTYEFEFEYVE